MQKMSNWKTWGKSALASTAAAGTLVMSNANAALVDADVVNSIKDAIPEMEMIGAAVIAVVAIVVVFSMVMAIIRKA